MVRRSGGVGKPWFYERLGDGKAEALFGWRADVPPSEVGIISCEVLSAIKDDVSRARSSAMSVSKMALNLALFMCYITKRMFYGNRPCEASRVLYVLYFPRPLITATLVSSMITQGHRMTSLHSARQ